MSQRTVSYTHLAAPEVEVLHDGTWCFGSLHEWRQGHDGRWSGWVRYTIGIGQTLIGVIDQDQLRPFEPAHGPVEANGRPPATGHPRPATCVELRTHTTVAPGQRSD